MVIVPEIIANYLNKNLRKCLEQEERNGFFREHPNPILIVVGLQIYVDNYMEEFLGRRLPTQTDGESSRLQKATLNCVAHWCQLGFVC